MSFRDKLLGAGAVPTEEVAFPELGGERVVVRGMTARERTEFERTFRTKKGTPIEQRNNEIRERLVIACCRALDGKPVFTEADVQALGQVRSDLVSRIFNVAAKLCGMTDADVDEIAKNSAATTDDGSPTA